MTPAGPHGQLDQFFLLSHDLFCCIDLDGRMLQVNPAFETLLGYPADALLGKPCGKVIDERDHGVIEGVLARIVEGRDVAAFEVRARSVTRALHWLEVDPSLGEGVVYVVARVVTERKRVEEHLKRTQQLFEIVGKTALIGGWYVDMDEGKPIWSDEVCHIHGVAPGFQPTIDEAIAFYTPTYQPRIRAYFDACCEHGISFDDTFEIITHDYQPLWVRVIGKAVCDSDGNVIRVQGSTQDITQRKATERQLQLLERSVESSTNGVLIVDAGHDDLPIVYANTAFERITGYSRQEALGRNCRFLQGEDTDPNTVKQLRQGIAAESEVHVVIRNYRRSGAPFWNDLYISPVRDDLGQVTHFVGVQNDISEQREYQAQLAYNASHDALTGLPNRMLLTQRLEQGCLVARRYQRHLAVLFIDLDDFKPINDTLGHEVGDFILVEVAKRLEDELRPWDTIARFGGDEFVVLLPDLAHENDVIQVVERILKRLATPYWQRGGELRITASIGVAMNDGLISEPLQLIQQADLAMYKAKRRGRNTCQWYTDDLNRKVSERVSLRNALQQAIEQEEFELYFQPQIHGPSGRVIGVEALIRWQHPERGFVSPGDFIPLAEDTGQIIPISDWVLTTACRVAKQLNGLGLGRITMAVNVSPMQFQRPGFLASIQLVLEESGLAADLLELELTEGVLMDSAEQAIQALQDLRQLGVHIAMDDFGTGFSSLSYLKHLPINKIKIDRSFINDVVSDHRDAAIVEGVLTMAAKLDLDVLVEGVETAAQYAYLRQQLCDYFQGFYFARPMPLEALLSFLCEQQRHL
ncbi:bifunctional diguanylate cyclase/phosphodiesterase [Vreelandella arcis]|uniref:cyclic-guanylate-specific phosphodiesterase n=1 Tax=Vreelandella arcis TaxID=416873 RepID=A0A1G9X9C0_9GAMM|nr:bifunctional diguanylate cyclase/phosphodiesterase [Halomonas arcis]SDM93328.1 PAS domain S-box-containing protein/diguanylate cyclase (GGDEF) domain-containing protein [Halomonas arcis]